jgi:hypothetical protein
MIKKELTYIYKDRIEDKYNQLIGDNYHLTILILYEKISVMVLIKFKETNWLEQYYLNTICF